MAGKIVADTLEHSTAGSVSTQYVVEGSAKAWTNFDGTAVTNPASLTGVRDSSNITSLLDNGTADYTISYVSSLANADYSISGISANMGSTMSQIWIANSAYVTSSSFRMLTLYVSNLVGGGSTDDQTFVSLQIQGDLA